MAETSIEWADRSWNFLAGCALVSPGCTNCYAVRQAARIERMNPALEHYRGLIKPSKAGPVWTGKIGIAEHKLLEPLSVRKPKKWFVNSMSDLFHESVPDEVIDRAFAVMALAPHHTFQVLTKRSARMREYMVKAAGRIADAVMALRRETGIGKGTSVAPLPHITPGRAWWPLPNVWLGVSVEDQKRADERIPDLLATPAAVRWISAEPLLGAIEFNEGWIDRDCCQGPSGIACPECPEVTGKPYPYVLDWIVVGGESGPNARPIHPDWVRSLRDQCAASGVPFFFKQWGEWGCAEQLGADHPTLMRIQSDASRGRVDQICHIDSFAFGKVGKVACGRLLDGREHNDLPSPTGRAE